MKRIAYQELLNWKNNKSRKPLLLQGARQVGKTFLISEFGRKEYKNLYYLNFEKDKNLITLFDSSLNPGRIISDISLYMGKKIVSEESLLFFDEIQFAPRALTSLKYFQEEAPDFNVIAAGSLLGLSVGTKNNFPVGKVNFLSLFPMSFTEYLMAANEELFIEKLNSMDDIAPFQ